MSNAKQDETKAAVPAKRPDGKSQLPKSNTPFPTPTNGGGSDPPPGS